MKVIVTIPAYNEEKTLGNVLGSIKAVMDQAKYDYRLLVVDDGSKDRTAAVAKKAGAVVVSHPKNYGLAEAFRTEMQKCLEMKADVIVHTDADGQYRASEIPGMIKKVQAGYDLVLGSRFKGKIESMPLIKRLGNRAFSRVLSNITGTRISDGQTGFRAFNRKVAEDIKIESNHTYTQEQIIRAVREKFRIAEVPAYFAKRGGGTKSRLMKNPFEYALKAWISIFRVYRDYQPLKFFGYLSLLVFIPGIIIGIWLVSLWIRFGVIGHVPLLMLTVLLIVIGVQVALFGFLADMFRK